MEREVMEYDVVIVGAGPSGLSAAIRLKQLAAERNREISVCLIEKGSEVGAHLLSGAVIEPRALNELIPDWKQRGAPVTVEAREDRFVFLTQSLSLRLPTPPQMHCHGNYVVSVAALGRWMAQQAEELGVEIYAGFSGAEILYDEQGAVVGVATGDMGVNHAGEKTDQFQPGVELRAKQVIFAEGCRGSLTKLLFDKFGLDKGCDPQVFGVGVKEIWEVQPTKHRPGLLIHTVGWPLDFSTYGGAFIYHMDNNQVAVGFVVGLDYRNPHLSPFEEFQRFKTHPSHRPLFEGGRRVAYGARALSEGGLQSLPKLTFPGGVLVGDTAGFLNVPKIKGVHTAMKSGMVAAESVFEHLATESPAREVVAYANAIKKSWIWEELQQARNIRPAFTWGLFPAIAYSAVDTFLFRGRAPWTLRHHHPDHTSLRKASESPKIKYPKPDGVVTFDRLSSVYLANINHEEDQPNHLRLRNAETPIKVNLELYDAPEQRYCPAGVYEVVCDADGKNPKMQINAGNCVHCKTCDIKDPTQNIDWVTPQGGSGPNYTNM
ncbi:Electron transfer flavoprotein-ubiquinone oxidoreductase [Azospirillaceae bacterium]